MQFGSARHFRDFVLVGAVSLAVNGAYAAELPGREAKKGVAPKAETCDIDGRPGFRLPGGDTCMRISGYVSAGVTAAGSKPH
jgi:hypothetical protein